jgi:hypothetical protein
VSETESVVAQILNAAQRLSNNKTTVELEGNIMLNGKLLKGNQRGSIGQIN